MKIFILIFKYLNIKYSLYILYRLPISFTAGGNSVKLQTNNYTALKHERLIGEGILFFNGTLILKFPIKGES